MAWIVAVLCGILGVVLFVGGVVGGVSDLAPTKTFASGESVTITADPADKPAIYISTDTPVNYTCQISGGTGQAKLARTTGSETVTLNGVVWEQILVVNAPAKGDYQVTCGNEGTATVRYGVGKPLSSAVSGIAGGTLTGLLAGGAGLLAAVIATVVVLVRRSSARKRLAAAG
ncbi:hypothetical protein MF672_039875 [Actinomadura sp. ATCC 31491]|uniref:Uncharacterized protein n=1 Tax=Actinomadura luzonensis TaxID=2805427 RepID=A0ABT0G734_9ACTN|nr:hypothetical protein [Actinomadura luzonensis]MCK2219913.1 hypothetical protein [Actinomadura luzonensis]